MVSQKQWERVQSYIRLGLEEGARLLTGGEGRPDGLERGWFVRPTIFTDVNNDMRIAREEIFGPVLASFPIATRTRPIAIANDTPYGLQSYVLSGDPARARRVAAELRPDASSSTARHTNRWRRSAGSSSPASGVNSAPSAWTPISSLRLSWSPPTKSCLCAEGARYAACAPNQPFAFA